MMMGVLLALIVFFSSLMVQTYREYKNFRVRELRIEAKLTQARKEFEQKEMYLARMLEDPELIPKILMDTGNLLREQSVDSTR